MLRLFVASLGVILFLLFGFSPAASAGGIALYVAPGGNDQWSGRQAAAGKTDGPLATLTAARDAIRKLKQAGALATGGVNVEIAPGIYRLADPLELNARDSGTAEAPIVYRAAKRGTAVVTGGAVLADWRPVSDPKILKLIDPTAKGKVVWTELGTDLPATLPGFTNGGDGFRGRRDYPLALYQENQRLPVARWPNEGFVMTGQCLGESRPAGHMGIRYIEGRFVFKHERLARWAHEPELWFNGLWYVPWADSKLQLKSIDLQARSIALKDPENSPYGYMPDRHFYAFNAIGEIDRPGEWAVDRAKRRLYLWPAADLKTNPVVLATGETLVKAATLSFVTFDGLVFEACRHNALNFTRCTAVTVAASTVRHTGGWAVNLDGGERGSVVGCDLYDLGEGGVNAVGGNRDKLIPGRHLIENNHIHHIGRVVACYRPGASVLGVGNAIRHNLIYQTDHQAIFFDGNDHVIEYNIVHDVCLHTSDAGPLYACTRDWSKRGTVIRHNLFHAAGEGVDACGCRGIYLDDHTSATTVSSNIVSQADCGINLGGGKDNIVVDNIAVNCRQPVSLDSRGVDSFAKVDAARGKESSCYRHLSRDVYRSALWRDRYPNMLAPLAMDPIEAQNAHGNTIRNNVSAGSGDVKVSNAKHVMRTCVVEQNPVVDEDPGFVDLFGLDLRLRADAPILKKLPGFHAPDFVKMGLYDDPRRASPAVKFGPDVTPMQPIMSPDARAQAEIATLFPVHRVPGPDALIQSGSGGAQSPRASRARLAVDGEYLSIVITNDVDPKQSLALGQVWGTDDGVEVALCGARGPGRQDAERPFVLRGYAGGRFQSTTAGGVSSADAQRLAQGVHYAASTHGEGSWEARWQIPLAALAVTLQDNHLPILAQITIYRSAGKTWATWSPQHARDTWNVLGAYALWLTPLGDLAFLPGTKPSVARVAVRWGRQPVVLRAGPGAENPTWAPSGSRIEAPFGAVLADRWYAYEFEFTPESDGEVVIELLGTQGTPTAWTYYDDFRVEGAKLVNGDFETVGHDGRVQGWRVPAAADLPALLIEDARLAASGSHMVMASHDYRTAQSIAVRKDRKVTVRFKARGVLGTGQPAGKPASAGQKLADQIRRTLEPLAAARPRAAAIDGFAHLVRKTSWTEEWPAADGTAVTRQVVGQVWNDAIAAALRQNNSVRLPQRDRPYYLDAPIVLCSGQTLVADPQAEIRLKPGTNTCMVRNAHPFNGQLGPVPAGLAPDENITVEGGIWTTLRTKTGVRSVDNDNRLARIDARNSIPGAHGVLCFSNVRRLLVRKVTVRQSTPFAVQLSNASQFVIEGVVFEDHGRDGIHINGPARDGLVRDIGGVTHDDFVALNAWDWKNSAMTFGPIERVLVERLHGTDRGAASLRLLPGTKRFAGGATLDCPVRDCVFRDITGLNDIKAYDQPNLELGRAKDYSEPIGTLSNLYLERLTIRQPRQPATVQIHANADGIHIDDVVFAFPRKPDDKLVSIGPLSMTFTFGSSDPARWVEVFSPDKDCTVRNLSLRNVRTADGAAAAALVRVIQLRPNPDYPRAKPRGGTGKGVWIP